MRPEEARQLQENVARGKKKYIKHSEQDLFGVTSDPKILEIYKQIFNAIIAKKNYLFVRGNVVGKKNNYIVQVRFTGKSECCNAIYDRKTKICTACGKITKSGKTNRGIGLNKKALMYYNSAKKILDREVNHQKFKNKVISHNFILVGLFFVRPTDARFDFDNVETMIGDLLQSTKLIKDDRAKMFMMIPMGYILNKENPGVFIEILDHNDYFNYLLSNYD